MITNTGKNIIAKYLIGEAPAYASFIALGCGPRPRPRISQKTNVSMGVVSGIVSSNGSPANSEGEFVTSITSIASTAGLYSGMSLTKTAGTGSLGTSPKIISIDTDTSLTVSANTSHSTGSISFNASGTSAILTTQSTEGLWLGAKVTMLDGEVKLSLSEDTIISAISSDSSFSITPGPTQALVLDSLGLEVDPNKDSLDFEMFRVPVSSRGYVNDNGVNKIILTAQLPTEERYEISEIGIYSAGSNTSAGKYDSKTVSSFSADEGWKLFYENTVVAASPESDLFTEAQSSLINGLNFMTLGSPAIKTSASNGIFANSVRSDRYEQARYLSNVLLLKGNSSYIYENEDSNLVISGEPSYLQISGTTLDLTKNSSSDLLKVAFSIISVDGNSSAVPDSAKVIVEFSNSDGSQFAQMQVAAKDSVNRFSKNRYIVASRRLDELFYSTGQFSWNNVTTIKVYVSTTQKLLVVSKAADDGIATLTTSTTHGLNVNEYVKVSGVDQTFNGAYKVTGVPSATSFEYERVGSDISVESVAGASVEVPTESFYISLDAVRFDNVSTVNPLYGMTGYSIVQNIEKETITKFSNTTNYVEYRFILDVT
jgi:hypothetical protein